MLLRMSTRSTRSDGGSRFARTSASTMAG